MKSMKYFIFILISVLSLGACAQDVPVADTEDTHVAVDGKILIVFFRDRDIIITHPCRTMWNGLR